MPSFSYHNHFCLFVCLIQNTAALHGYPVYQLILRIKDGCRCIHGDM